MAEIASVLGMTGVIGFLVISPVMQIYGRKAVNILKTTVLAISWVTFYFAESLPALFVARAIQGFSMGSIFTNIIIIGEYVSPSRRGYFATIQKIAVSGGGFVCHLMAIWCTWRQIALTALFLPVASMILTSFWKESPFFLAMKGRFVECEKSFHYLNGTSSRNKELSELISDQKKSIEEKKKLGDSRIGAFLQLIRRPEFLKSFSIGAVLIMTVELTGRNYFKAYVVQIMIILTGDMSTALYISLIADLIVLISLILSCVAVKYFNRRTILFSTGVVNVLSYFGISLILYLKSYNIITVWSWLPPGLILFMIFIVHVGVSPVCFVILSEIFPLEFKGLGSFLTGMVFTTSYAIVLKLTSVFMETIGIEGTYIVYGAGLGICLTILYFIVPETKDRTLLDIENNLRGINQVDVSEGLLREGA